MKQAQAGDAMLSPMVRSTRRLLGSLAILCLLTACALFYFAIKAPEHGKVWAIVGTVALWGFSY
jgi:hypothetical protein